MFFRLGTDPLRQFILDDDGGGGGGGGGNGDGDKTWHENLPEDIRADPSLVDFKDESEMISMPINVARSFIATKQLVGRDKIPMPKTKEEWDDTYNRLGRPEGPSLYNLTTDDIENSTVKEQMGNSLEWLRKTAHDMGLSDVQTKSFLQAHVTKMTEELKGVDVGLSVAMREAEKELRETYGNSFEGKMILMNRGLDELDSIVGGGLKDLIKASDFSKHPKFIRSMVTVGEMMAEDLGLDKHTGGTAVTPETIQGQIDTLTKSDAYLKADDPAHSDSVTKVANLMQQLHGKKPVDVMTRSSFVS